MGQGVQGCLLSLWKVSISLPNWLTTGMTGCAAVGPIHCSRRWERQHLFASPLVLIPCSTTLQRDSSCCGQGCLLSLLLWSELSLKPSHASSAGRAPGEVPGVRSWLAGPCWLQSRSYHLTRSGDGWHISFTFLEKKSTAIDCQRY